MATAADKRSVATDALETLGTIIDETAGRDAIHLAVEPVIAAERLFAGQDVGFVDGGVGTKAKKLVGIVDPFLKESVQKGQRFWLVVYPRQITSLRHVWTHPSFSEEPVTASAPAPIVPETPEKTEAEKSKIWIEDYANGLGVNYDELLSHAAAYQFSDWHYWNGGSRFEGEYIPEEFWTHYTNVTGNKATKTGSFFTCSC